MKHHLKRLRKRPGRVGDDLGDITISKKTVFAFAALAFALLLGVYVVFSTPGPAAPLQENGGNASGQENQSVTGGNPAGAGGDSQDIYIRALSSGTYDKQEITVSSGIPVRLHFTADPAAGCGRQLVVYGLGVKAVSRSGEEQVVEFTPIQAGEYEYNCGMRMWQPGKLVVT